MATKVAPSGLPTQHEDQLFAMGRDLAEILLKKLGTGRFKLSPYRRAMLFFFTKAYKTYQATIILWKNGYTEDATALARSIYEIRLQAHFMASDPTNRSEQFVAHMLRSEFGTLQILKRSGRQDWQSGLDVGEADLRQAAANYGMSDLLADAQVAERSIKKKWWGAGGVKRLLTDLGLDEEKEYDIIYSQLSDYAHSGVRIFTKYVQLSEELTRIICYPTKSNSLTVPFSITDWLFQIAGFTGRAFDLGFDEAVVSAQKDALACIYKGR